MHHHMTVQKPQPGVIHRECNQDIPQARNHDGVFSDRVLVVSPAALWALFRVVRIVSAGDVISVDGFEG